MKAPLGIEYWFKVKARTHAAAVSDQPEEKRVARRWSQGIEEAVPGESPHRCCLPFTRLGKVSVEVSEVDADVDAEAVAWRRMASRQSAGGWRSRWVASNDSRPWGSA